MPRRYTYVSSILMAATLCLPVAFGGCAARASYRVYDPAYGDYHLWDHNEAAYYQRWEVETHREHRDFAKRSADEQKEYWKWHHSHSDEKH